MAGQYPFINPGSFPAYSGSYQANSYVANQQQIPSQTQIPYPAPQMQQTMRSDDAAKIVATVSEAENYPLAPMQTVYFIALNDSALCVKSTDPVRVPFVVYDLTKRNAEKPKDYVTREEFDELKKSIDELLK